MYLRLFIRACVRAFVCILVCAAHMIRFVENDRYGCESTRDDVEAVFSILRSVYELLPKTASNFYPERTSQGERMI